MLNIEQSITHKFPNFAHQAPLIKKSTLGILRKIMREGEINSFLKEHEGNRGFDFIDGIFDYFHFSYSVSQRERNYIPAQGRVVIIANHPIGSLDGLALLRLVGEIRRDVKIVANDMLMAFEPLRDLLLPLDNMTRGVDKQSYKKILQCLHDDNAVIFFPSGEVSRVSPQGIRDGKWHAGFLHFARKTQSPLLPVFVSAKNSLLFYSASMLFKPLGTALLAHEMFNKHSAEVSFRIGELIPSHALESKQLSDKALIKRLKKHVYKIGARKHEPIFITEKTVAHPEDSAFIKQELKTAILLGKTQDNCFIYLCDYHRHPSVLKEIGRLRELTFRSVGEGTGSSRDLDKYDQYYQHLVLWDDDKLNIAGAYRLGDTRKIKEQKGKLALYTADLFEFYPAMDKYLDYGLELGRSFVHPLYQGKASLDYLWQGLGAYLKHDSAIRYIFGPVSMSAAYPKYLRDLLAFYYLRYYTAEEDLAVARHPHVIDEDTEIDIHQRLLHLDRKQAFAFMQEEFVKQGHKIPVLFKQYAALYEENGYKLLAFSVDTEFGDCLDGLFMADLESMKASRRERYLS
jgi:putative hemolysin